MRTVPRISLKITAFWHSYCNCYINIDILAQRAKRGDPPLALWVSENLGSAIEMLKAMAGNNWITMPASLMNIVPSLPVSHGRVDSGIALLVSSTLLAIAWIAPNTQQITSYIGPKGVYGSNEIVTY